MLLGETGTGKELLARAIHLSSKRGRGRFVPVNCAAINEDTMLSELFGHIRGAFSGAIRNREGLVRRAHKGTLFLDEVGDMPLSMQIAMLRAIEDKEVRPVGSTRDRPADVRVIAATNRDLHGLLRSGLFRQDLYHRLNVVEMELPPLRRRLADLAELAQHILAGMKPARTLHVDTQATLARYDWPGNVRELQNVLQAAALLSEGEIVHPDVIEQILASRRRSKVPAASRLAPRAAAILRLLAGGWHSAPRLAEDLGVSTRTVNRDLLRLTERGLVDCIGEARSRRYSASTEARRDLSGNAGR